MVSKTKNGIAAVLNSLWIYSYRKRPGKGPLIIKDKHRTINPEVGAIIIKRIQAKTNPEGVTEKT